ESDALDAVMRTPALTPEALRLKLALADDRDMRGWYDWAEVNAVIVSDLQQMQRPAASIGEGFLAWRVAYDAVASGEYEDDEVGDALSDARSAAYHALMALPCTTPGDFIAKAYVNLLESVGGCSA